VDHRRGGGGKHISSFDEVKARNNGEETAYDKARRAKKGEDVDENESGSEKEEEATKTTRKAPADAIQNPNAVKRNEMKEGVEITRREREELEKQAARRRYEELHKQGKTEEAQKDLARLEEVKRRREEAEKKRKEDQAAAERKEEASKEKPRGAMINELKDIMGTESKKRGKKKSKKEDEDEGEDAEKEKEEGEVEEQAEEKKKEKKEKKDEKTWQSTISAVKTDDKASQKKTDGSIQACRAAEEDFM